MRRALAVLAALAAVSAWANDGRAQQIGVSDPFFLYYGYFLPRQAALAAQPRVEDTINASIANQQSYAATNRSNLYDPNGGYGRFDPHSTYDRFAPTQGGAAPAGAPSPSAQRMRSTVAASNASGGGPPIYFNRTSQFYPGIRSGRGPNKNMAVAGAGVRRGSSVGVPAASSGMGLPGPR